MIMYNFKEIIFKIMWIILSLLSLIAILFLNDRYIFKKQGEKLDAEQKQWLEDHRLKDNLPTLDEAHPDVKG